jgi:anti-sigma-K factor RskA
MTGEGDRLSRAGSYVLGLMNATDRERAERDLELDPAFRDAVLEAAERMRVLDVVPEKTLDPAERWQAVAAHIGTMPQMQGLVEAPRTIALADKPRSVGQGLHAVPTRRALVFAISLIAAFAAGYLAGLWGL